MLIPAFSMVPAIEQLIRLGISVIFLDGLPKGLYEGKGNIDSIKERFLLNDAGA